MKHSPPLSAQTRFPFDGEMFYPDQKKFEEIIIFTHHYGGNKKNLHRHIQFVNQLGFQAFGFNLYPQPFKNSWELVRESGLKFSSIGSRWKNQFKKILSLIEGPKIVFSFSFSCNLTSSLAHQYPDIKALIFDGGPFAEPIRNPWLYLSHQEVIANPVLRALMIIPWNIFFNFFLLKLKIKRGLGQLPQDFPILSFQAVDDVLVPPKIIQGLLNSQQHCLRIQTAFLEETKHLQGMKKHPNLYQKILKEFLVKHARPL